MKSYTLAALALVLLGGALRGQDGEAAEQERKLLNGKWELTRSVADGKEQPAGPQKVLVALKDGKYTITVGGKVIGEGTYTIDPTTSPRSMDVLPSQAPGRGRTTLVIYEVKGDVYRVCGAPPGAPRPRAFESEEGSKLTLCTYKRVKP
jgi:uncharacterized protein (TIGR03067 family)